MPRGPGGPFEKRPKPAIEICVPRPAAALRAPLKSAEVTDSPRLKLMLGPVPDGCSTLAGSP